MARRIVLTMLALIGALLVTTVVPLGLITTGHERSSFRQDTILSARTLAGLAEDRLADQPPAGPPRWPGRWRRPGRPVSRSACTTPAAGWSPARMAAAPRSPPPR